MLAPRSLFATSLLCETDMVLRCKRSLPRCHCKQSRNGVSDAHAVRRVTKSVCQVKSVHACLLLTSHVKAERIGCVANDFSHSLHMTNALRELHKHILCLAVKVRSLVLVKGLEGIFTRPAERIR